MNDHVVDGSRWKIKLKLLPVRSIVERNPDASFRTCVEQPFAFGIFANGVDVRIIRKAGDEFGPSFPKIIGLENERLEVVEFVRIDTHIGGGRIEG